MNEILYPAPRINWYPVAERHPSLVDGAAPEGLRQPLVSKAQAAAAAAAAAEKTARSAQTSARPAAAACSQGNIQVVVVNAQGIAPPEEGFGSSDEAGSYMVTAYYQGEPQVVTDQRRTQPVQGEPSKSWPSREDCTLQARVHVPYNPKQQFLKVALLRHCSDGGDSFVGEATVPIADPSVADVNAWSLKLPGDFVERGYLRLSVKLPGEGEGEETPLAAAAVPSSSSTSPAHVPHSQANGVEQLPRSMSSAFEQTPHSSASWSTPGARFNGGFAPPPLVTICEADIPVAVAPPTPPSRSPLGAQHLACFPASRAQQGLVMTSQSYPPHPAASEPPPTPVALQGGTETGGLSGAATGCEEQLADQLYSPPGSSLGPDPTVACCGPVLSAAPFMGQGLSAAPYVPRPPQAPQSQLPQQPQLLHHSVLGMHQASGSTVYSQCFSPAYVGAGSTGMFGGPPVSYAAQPALQATPWQPVVSQGAWTGAVAPAVSYANPQPAASHHRLTATHAMSRAAHSGMLTRY